MTPDVPTLAVWKFASCDGCQLSLLDCEDELLALAGAVRIAHFTEMTRAHIEGPYDVSLVEGSITTAEDAERILAIRAASHRLITIGACATSGGVQALRNFAAAGEFVGVVYAHPEYVSSLSTSTPISDHVPVDFELNGCPIDRHQLLEVITSSLVGRRPVIPDHTVCQQCKGRGAVCVLVAHGTPCLGPVTRAGCGALCPAVGRGCYGCFGPVGGANTGALAEHLLSQGMAPVDASRLFSTFYSGNEVFGRQSVSLRSRGKVRGGTVTSPDERRRTVSVQGLARVEGEGSLRVEVRDGRVEDVELQIFEPPRFFEAFLRGRRATEAPDLTARICGICPVAYQMSACAAVEDALGISVHRGVADLRRLLYCGEWLQSHSLHVHMLHAPDFLGCQDAVEMAQQHRAGVRAGTRARRRWATASWRRSAGAPSIP